MLDRHIHAAGDTQIAEGSPEVGLWLAVIERAMRDALGKDSVIAREARNWILDYAAGFRLVCAAADVDPGYVARLTREARDGKKVVAEWGKSARRVKKRERRVCGL